MANRVDAEYLHNILDYNENTGLLLWKPRDVSFFESERTMKGWNTRYAGTVALNSCAHGYLYGRIFGVAYYAHRVAWAMSRGEWPKVIDHVNGNRSDNRLLNLRNTTQRGNLQNCRLSATNSSGTTGIFWLTKRSKWQAGIKVNGKYRYLGIFHDINDAISARKSAESSFGFHKNHGRAS